MADMSFGVPSEDALYAVIIPCKTQSFKKGVAMVRHFFANHAGKTLSVSQASRVLVNNALSALLCETETPYVLRLNARKDLIIRSWVLNLLACSLFLSLIFIAVGFLGTVWWLQGLMSLGSTIFTVVLLPLFPLMVLQAPDSEIEMGMKNNLPIWQQVVGFWLVFSIVYWIGYGFGLAPLGVSAFERNNAVLGLVILTGSLGFGAYFIRMHEYAYEKRRNEAVCSDYIEGMIAAVRSLLPSGNLNERKAVSELIQQLFVLMNREWFARLEVQESIISEFRNKQLRS